MIRIDFYSQLPTVYKQIETEACLQFDKKMPLFIDYIYDEKKVISTLQNRSLHLWFRQCSAVLSKDGHLCNICHPIISGGFIEKPWDEFLFKEFIYKPTLQKSYGLASTQAQDAEIINSCVEAIAMAFSKIGVVLPYFPSIETQGLISNCN